MAGLTLAEGGIIPRDTDRMSGGKWSELDSECPAGLMFGEESYGKGNYQSLLVLISLAEGVSE